MWAETEAKEAKARNIVKIVKKCINKVSQREVAEGAKEVGLSGMKGDEREKHDGLPTLSGAQGRSRCACLVHGGRILGNRDKGGYKDYTRPFGEPGLCWMSETLQPSRTLMWEATAPHWPIYRTIRLPNLIGPRP